MIQILVIVIEVLGIFDKQGTLFSVHKTLKNISIMKERQHWKELKFGGKYLKMYMENHDYFWWKIGVSVPNPTNQNYLPLIEQTQSNW